MGGFDLGGAQTVCGGGDVERYQVLDQLALLVDKSLVVADESGSRTRYRLLETVRQYGLEKLGESGEADIVRTRHRDHYTSIAAASTCRPAMTTSSVLIKPRPRSTTCAPPSGGAGKIPISNWRLTLASSLQPLWQSRGRLREGLTWFDTALADLDAHQSWGVARCAGSGAGR